MLDIIIRGGDVVTPQGVAICDVAIAGEALGDFYFQAFDRFGLPPRRWI